MESSLNYSAWKLYGFFAASKRVYAARVYAVLPSYKSNCLRSDTGVATDKKLEKTRSDPIVASALVLIMVELQSFVSRSEENLIHTTSLRVIL